MDKWIDECEEHQICMSVSPPADVLLLYLLSTAPPTPDPMSCPPPYYRAGNYCLTLLHERVNWEGARIRCHRFAQSRGAVGEGDLAMVDDMDTFKAFVAETDFREYLAAHFDPSDWCF